MDQQFENMTTFGDRGLTVTPQDRLQIFTNHADIYVQQSAQSALLLTQELEAGGITRAEYDELIADIVDLQRMDQEVQGFERKRVIAEALEVIKQIVGLVSKVL